jgi:DNA polymerase-3 subunit chi
MEVRFYHLQSSTVEQALPSLLEKALQQEMRAVVLAGSEERLQSLDSGLWTYRPDSFLPHGTAADGHAADQPIWLTVKPENPNSASVLFSLDGQGIDGVENIKLACDIFDGADPEALAAARERWKAAKEQGHELTYWQQGERGGWEKKN